MDTHAPIGLSVLFQSHICHSLGAGTHFQSVFGIGGQCEVHVQMCLYGVGNRIQTAVSVSVYGLGIALIGDGDLCADGIFALLYEVDFRNGDRCFHIDIVLGENVQHLFRGRRHP